MAILLYGHMDEYGGFHKWGTPHSWMVFIMDNPIQVDDLGVPLFQGTSTWDEDMAE